MSFRAVQFTSTLLLCAAAWTTSVRAQGSLTPPAGPIAPVMRSLDQIEPRTPLVAGAAGVEALAGGEFVITNSGSYYLTKSLVSTNPALDCIEIRTNAMNVTLDLNGLTVSRTNGPSGRSGIYIRSASGQYVLVRNGFIAGSGSGGGLYAGVYSTSSTLGNVHVENVHVRNSGYAAFYLNRTEARNAVRHCSVEQAGEFGIVADIVANCAVREAGGVGIAASLVSDCYVRLTSGTGDAIGSDAAPVSVIMNSIGESSGGIGVRGDSVINCTASTSASSSIPALKASVANNCTASHAGGRAIEATVANGCFAKSGTNAITHKYNMP
jgi:hypothetical protein